MSGRQLREDQVFVLVIRKLVACNVVCDRDPRFCCKQLQVQKFRGMTAADEQKYLSAVLQISAQ